MEIVEQQVRASAQARVDRDNVNRAVTEVLRDPSALEKEQAVTTQWSVSVAAGVASGLILLLATQTLWLAGLSTFAVTFIASRNPTEEDNPAGAAARILGRATLSSVESATPKAKAMARVAWSGRDELTNLREENQLLQKEVTQLRLWKQRRSWIDEHGPDFNLQELKDVCRRNNLLVGGTKTQLLMRLLEARIIRIE